MRVTPESRISERLSSRIDSTKGTIDLHLVQRQLMQIAQDGKPGTKIIQ